MKTLFIALISVFLLATIQATHAATANMSSPAWNPVTGDLAYVRNADTIMVRDPKVRFPFTVWKAKDNEPFSNLSWNPDGINLLYTQTCPDLTTVQMLEITDGRAMREQEMLSSPQLGINYIAAKFNHTGKLLAYVACGNSANGCAYYVQDLQTGVTIPTNESTATPGSITWLPNTDELALIIERGGIPQMAVWGKITGTTILTDFQSDVTLANVATVGGSMIMFNSGKGKPGLFTYDIATGVYNSFINMVGTQPDWHGSNLAYVNVQGDDQGQIMIYSVPAQTYTCLTCG